MLPSQLLRVRTKKGEIFPLLIGGENKSGHLQLAKIIINEFEELAAKKEKKKILYERISLVERNFDDYRLVRGLSKVLLLVYSHRNSFPQVKSFRIESFSSPSLQLILRIH